ncbi:hypothetical protein HUJ05_000955 [Dendroctonus ponderosae]|nr:hypothetical protein HUJ05_000955 [Dendroctonus ponderosae]
MIAKVAPENQILCGHELFDTTLECSYLENESGIFVEDSLKPSQNDVAENNQDTENKLNLINPHCPIGIVRDYISSNLRISEDNEDTKQCPPTMTGLDVLKDKETYYIILLNRNNDQPSASATLTPLLNPGSREYLEFMAQQQKKLSITKKKRSSKGSSIVSSNAESCLAQTGSEISRNVLK